MSRSKDPKAVALGKRRLAAPKVGEKNPDAVALGRRGGLAAAAALTAEERAAKGRKAIAARWTKRNGKGRTQKTSE